MPVISPEINNVGSLLQSETIALVTRYLSELVTEILDSFLISSLIMVGYELSRYSTYSSNGGIARNMAARAGIAGLKLKTISAAGGRASRLRRESTTFFT